MYKILQRAAVDSYCDYMLYLFSPLVVIRVLLYGPAWRKTIMSIMLLTSAHLEG